jgi:hypothetical protein
VPRRRRTLVAYSNAAHVADCLWPRRASTVRTATVRAAGQPLVERLSAMNGEHPPPPPPRAVDPERPMRTWPWPRALFVGMRSCSGNLPEAPETRISARVHPS